MAVLHRTDKTHGREDGLSSTRVESQPEHSLPCHAAEWRSQDFTRVACSEQFHPRLIGTRRQCVLNGSTSFCILQIRLFLISRTVVTAPGGLEQLSFHSFKDPKQLAQIVSWSLIPKWIFSPKYSRAGGNNIDRRRAAPPVLPRGVRLQPDWAGVGGNSIIASHVPFSMLTFLTVSGPTFLSSGGFLPFSRGSCRNRGRHSQTRS